MLSACHDIQLIPLTQSEMNLKLLSFLFQTSLTQLLNNAATALWGLLVRVLRALALPLQMCVLENGILNS